LARQPLPASALLPYTPLFRSVLPLPSTLGSQKLGRLDAGAPAAEDEPEGLRLQRGAPLGFHRTGRLDLPAAISARHLHLLGLFDLALRRRCRRRKEELEDQQNDEGDGDSQDQALVCVHLTSSCVEPRAAEPRLRAPSAGGTGSMPPGWKG